MLVIFHDITLSFDRDKSYAIMGASGSGKSTLLHMLAGIEMPTNGSIFYDEYDLIFCHADKMLQFLQASIGIVFQQPLLIQELSVLENCMLKYIISDKIENEHKNRAMKLLEQVGLEEKADCMPSMLSGGQQQRIAIVRAIMNKPQFLLADEPTGNLDKVAGAQILNLLFHYQKQFHMGLIISTHDMSIAQQCDYIVVIESKQLMVKHKNKDY
ncbi:ABC transporter ATP-binding protein [Candidatus Dependentiae bacterium]|nr:ABC transporter ATP-binding protein [Candidatus Dependentiae bacterium]